MIVGTAVSTKVVVTAALELFVPAVIVGTVVTTIIVLTAFYWKSCLPNSLLNQELTYFDYPYQQYSNV